MTGGVVVGVTATTGTGAARGTAPSGGIVGTDPGSVGTGLEPPTAPPDAETEAESDALLEAAAMGSEEAVLAPLGSASLSPAPMLVAAIGAAGFGELEPLSNRMAMTTPTAKVVTHNATTAALPRSPDAAERSNFENITSS